MEILDLVLERPTVDTKIGLRLSSHSTEHFPVVEAVAGAAALSGLQLGDMLVQINGKPATNSVIASTMFKQSLLKFELRVRRGGTTSRLFSTSKHIADFPAAQSKPYRGCIVFLPDVNGIGDDSNRAFARMLSDRGFRVLLVDVFRDLPWDGGQSGMAYEEWRAHHPDEEVDRCVASAIAHAADGAMVCLLGVCFGGGCGYRAAVAGLPGLESAILCYPTRVEPAESQPLSVPTLLILAEEDECAHPTLAYDEYVRRLSAAADQAPVTVRVEVVAHSAHGFLHRTDKRLPGSSAHNHAFQMIEEFLAAHLADRGYAGLRLLPLRWINWVNSSLCCGQRRT